MEDVTETPIDSGKFHPCCSQSSGLQLQPLSLSQHNKILTCWLFFFWCAFIFKSVFSIADDENNSNQAEIN